ncbi:exported hypothetical protein [Candidatus Magnetomoraceae bacterium gMMP-1]
MKKFNFILFTALAFALAFPQISVSADWTFMVYLDGDNNLEGEAIDDFLEMASVGSDSNINIVVQLDRIPGEDSRFGNWKDCQRFLVGYQVPPRVQNAVSDWGDGLGGREVDMADPQTLIDFVEWGMDNYPAEKYALILWNHGGGWRDKLDSIDSISPSLKEVCYDDTTGWYEALYMNEVKSALAAINEEKGRVNLVGFDACLMGMIEVAYEIKDFADIMVGSEETEPAEGWPYNTLLADLVASPDMEPGDLGAIIVDRYGEAYDNMGDETQSAIDLSKLDMLASAVDFLSIMMMELDKSDLTEIRENCQEYYVPEFIDLYHFVELLVSLPNPFVPPVGTDIVMNALEETVIAEFHGRQSPGSHGLAIYFPAKAKGFDKDYNESIIDFPRDTQWDEFLLWYYGFVDEISLLTPEDGVVLPSWSYTEFAWEADSRYRYKIQFSPDEIFEKNLTFPKDGWMRNTSLDIPVWKKLKGMLKTPEDIVYWRVMGKTGPDEPEVISEVRTFSVE